MSLQTQALELVKFVYASMLSVEVALPVTSKLRFCDFLLGFT